jgi:hypothetical protein
VKPVDPVIVIRLKGELKRYEKVIQELSHDLWIANGKLSTLESEKECNRILTDELERLQMSLGNADLSGTLNGYTGKLRFRRTVNEHGQKSMFYLQQEVREDDGTLVWQDVDLVEEKEEDNNLLVDNG